MTQSIDLRSKRLSRHVLLTCCVAALAAPISSALAADIQLVVPPQPATIVVVPEDVPRFYVSVQALFMTRTNPGEQPILTPVVEDVAEVALLGPQETTVVDGIDAADIDYGWAFGVAGRVGMIGNPIGFDVGGFWLKPMEAIVHMGIDESRQYVLETDPTLGIYVVTPDGAEAFAATRIYGLDANATFALNNMFQAYAGVAFIRVRDLLELDINTDQFGLTEVDWATNNRLIGPQIGFRGMFGPGPLTFGFEVRAAYLFNHATGIAEFTNDPFVGDLTLEDDLKHRTLMLAGGINVGFNVTENLTITAGYQAMWFKQLALAPSQVPYTDPTDDIELNLNAGNPLLVHGLSVGLLLQF